MTPPTKPKATREQVAKAAASAWSQAHPGQPLPDLYVLAVRGYYANMGTPGVNDLGVYDDALFIVSPHGFSGWNANTDPSRGGWNDGAKKYMARLQPGVWKFRRLKHKMSSPLGYMAFGQGPEPVTVERIRKTGEVANRETGCFGINLHRGGINGTSSEGCLTLPPVQWPQFYGQLASALEIGSAKTFPLILINGPLP